VSVAAPTWRDAAPPEEFVRHGVEPVETEEVPRCPVCDGGDFAFYASGFDYEIQTCSNPWRFVRCADCGHVWLNPRPSVASLHRIYPTSYYAYNYSETINPVAVAGKAALDRRKLGSILGSLARPVGSYLDVGCGDGRFLRAMERHGVPPESIHGLDLDEAAVASLAEAGYHVRCERVEECDAIAEGSLDLVTMFHVIEHVADPGAVIAKLAGWLAPGGILALETPNLDSLDARLFRNGRWGGYHIPRHWNLFTAGTLGRMLSDCGLEVRETRFQTGHSFWMYSLHHVLRYGKPAWPRLARLFDPFRSLPVLMAFTGFDMLRAALGARTSAMLVLARKPEAS
jgi:2-polyprenyl-3-methyl-5-hydroxy-6-metoxy-1,4-benzoquinol methylase